MLVKQAIFESARTASGEGYQIVARSPDIANADLRALAAWGPSHDSLLPRLHLSRNFFRLPGGDFCVSRTAAVAGEYSQRGGQNVRTHFFLVPPALLARFANRPTALLDALLADGWCDAVPGRADALPAVHLPGGAALVDWAAVNRALTRLGPQRLAALVSAVLSHDRLLLAGAGWGLEALVGAVLSCVPLDQRCDLSFVTGLKPSGRRPVRLAAAPDDAHQRDRLVRRDGWALFDPAIESLFEPDESWVGQLLRALRGGQPRLLEALVASRADAGEPLAAAPV